LFCVFRVKSPFWCAFLERYGVKCEYEKQKNKNLRNVETLYINELG